jgi:hypothetical protein
VDKDANERETLVSFKAYIMVWSPPYPDHTTKEVHGTCLSTCASQELVLLERVVSLVATIFVVVTCIFSYRPGALGSGSRIFVGGAGSFISVVSHLDGALISLYRPE